MSELSRNTIETALCFRESILALYNAQTIKDLPVMVWLDDLFQNCCPTLPAVPSSSTGFSSSSPLPTSHIKVLEKTVSDGKSLSFLRVWSHCLLSDVLKKGSDYFFKCGGQVQEDSFAVQIATRAILTMSLKHPCKHPYSIFFFLLEPKNLVLVSPGACISVQPAA